MEEVIILMPYAPLLEAGILNCPYKWGLYGMTLSQIRLGLSTAQNQHSNSNGIPISLLSCGHQLTNFVIFHISCYSTKKNDEQQSFYEQITATLKQIIRKS